MRKVYMIEYVECEYNGNTLFEKSAFTSYRAASYFLINLGYDIDHTLSYDYEKEETYDDIDWTIVDDSYGNMWRANIHELLIVD